MTYDQAIEYIHGVYWRGSKLGLQRITELLSRMGNPQEALRFVHVAGTNGKGSVCAMLSGILQAQGYKTGLYISPYLKRFNERIQINGQEIPDDALCAVTAYVREFAEAMDDLPTEFEIVCAIAFEYFHRERCDIVILEVGLGGALDATNVIPPPLVAVLTAIDYDHKQYLGDTLPQIAAAKCGIIKRGGAVVSYAQAPEALAVVYKTCEQQDAPLTVCDFEQLHITSSTLDGQMFCYKQMRAVSLSLLGEHQVKNAALAIEAVFALRRSGCAVSDQAVYAGLEKAVWPGRFEVLCREPLVIFDGAHNPHGVRAAVAGIRQYVPDRQVIVLLGVLKDKEYDIMFETIDGIATEYIATQPDNPRALDAQALANALRRFGKPVSVQPDAVKAAMYAQQLALQTGNAVFAMGSLYLAGDIRNYFCNS